MDIDTLQIQIQAEAKSAGSTIDTLVGKINKLSVSLNQLDGSRIIAFSGGIKTLANASQALSNIKTPDFNRLAKNLTAMNNLDLSKLDNVSSNIQKLASSVNSISGIAGNISQITELSKSLSQLGYKSAEKAATNIPKLATSVNDLMSKLSKAPKVSQNLIDMTNALAKLARTGASSGRAANSLSTAFNALNTSSRNAYGGISKLSLGFGSFKGLLGKLAPLIGAVSLVNFGKQAIDTASSLTEVENVVNTTFGDYKNLVEEMSKTSIQDYGMSELTTKKIASRYQAMGTAMGFAQGKMAGMSIKLTQLAADMASFYDVEQEDVAKSLQSVFTGETEPLRKYGLDITNATLKQWALNNSLNANISAMSQSEKAMLRYQYVMANTSAAQDDFSKTQKSWANQVRILTENFKALGGTIGNVLINAFKPLVSTLNNVVSAVTSAVETIANALGAIFGWTIEISGGGSVAEQSAMEGMAVALNDIGDSAGGAGNNMGRAAKSAKELQRALMGFDKIEKLPDTSSSSGSSGGSGGSGGGSGGGGGGDTTGSGSKANIVPTETIFDKYKSDIKNLEQLGEYISGSLMKAMESIDWDSIYKKAENFGKGLAEFLNGMFKGQNGTTLFGEVGKTIASALNTVISASLGFTKNFNFYQFGVNLADGINNFFDTFDFTKCAESINRWAKGIKETIIGFIDTITWKSILKGAVNFLGTLNLDTVEVIIGAFILKGGISGIKQMMAGAISSALVGGVTLPQISLLIKGFSLATLSSPAFVVLGNEIIEGISAALESLMPKKAFNLLSNIGAGMALGAAGGTVIPGLGTVAGAIIGGIAGGILGGDKSVDEIYDAICNAWNNGKEKILEVSIGLKNGLTEGLTNFWNDLKNEWSILTKGKTLDGDTGKTSKHKSKSVTQYGGGAGRSFSVKVNYKNGNVKKQLLSPAQKVFEKNPLASKLKLGETKNSVQKKITVVSKDAKLEPTVKTKTTASQLQKQLNSLKTGYTMKFPSLVSNTSSDIQKQLNNKVKSFTLGVDAKANITQKDTTKLNKVIDGFTGNISKKTENGLSKHISGFTGNISKKTENGLSKYIGGFTGNISKKTTNGLNKTITGVTARISHLAYSGVLSVAARISSIFHKKDGGMFKNGRWSPITAYAGGGLPNQGQLFVAREAGPELVGKMPGGGTGIINNDQIVSSVSNGVYRAQVAAFSQLSSILRSNTGGTSPVINIYLDGKQMTDAVVERVNQKTRSTGVCPIIV